MIEKNASPPSLHDINNNMEMNYACIFPETFLMINIFLMLPLGTALVERSFSHLKMIERNHRILLRLCSLVR